MKKLIIILVIIISTYCCSTQSKYQNIEYKTSTSQYSVLNRPQNPPSDFNPVIEIDPGGHTSAVKSISASKSGMTIFSAGQDRTIRLFDKETGRQLRKFIFELESTGEKTFLNSVSLSPDENYIAVGGSTPGIRIFNVNSGKMVKIIYGPMSIIYDLKYSPDGKYIAAGFTDGTGGGIAVFSVLDNYQNIFEIRTDDNYPMDIEFFSKKNEVFLTAGYVRKGRIDIISVTQEKVIKTVTTTSVVRDIAVNENNIAAAFQENNLIIFYDFNLNKVRELRSEIKNPYKILFTPDNRYVVIGDGSGLPFKCISYELKTLQKVSEFTMHKGSVLSMAALPDNTILSGGVEGKIFNWNPETGTLVTEFGKHEEPIRRICTDGQKIFFAYNWTQNNSEISEFIFSGYIKPENFSFEFGEFSTPKVSFLNTEKDGLKIQAVSSTEIELTLNSREKKIISPGYGSRGLGITKDRLFVIGSWEGTISIFDSEGNFRAKLTGHDGVVSGFTEYKDYLVSCGDDRTIRFWDLGIIDDLSALPMSFIIKEVFPGGPADKSGLDTGDIITAVNGRKFNDTISFVDYVRNTNQCSFEIRRENRNITIDAAKEENEMYAFSLGTNESSLKPSISFYISQKEGLVAWTPDGAFEGSMGAGENIGFHVNQGLAYESDWLPLRQLADIYYKPGLVTDFFNGDQITSPPPIKSLKLPPILTALDIQKKDNLACIKLRCEDRGGDAVNIKLYRNNRIVETSIETTYSEKMVEEFELTSEMTDGKNVFLISAESTDKLTSFSNKIEFNNPTTNETNPELYILSSGVNTYSDFNLNTENRGLTINKTAFSQDSNDKKVTNYNYFPSLNYSVKDAEDFTAAYVAGAPNYFSSTTVIKLIDDNATKENIIINLTELSQKADSNDRVVMFFAGHGITVEKQYYFVPYGVNTLKEVKEFGISAAEITNCIEKIQADEIFLILDTCQSGATNDELSKSIFGALLLLGEKTGIWVMASSTESEASLESSQLENGLFTYCLTDVIKSAKDLPYGINFQEAALKTDKLIKEKLKILSTNSSLNQTIMFTHEMDAIFAQ